MKANKETWRSVVPLPYGVELLNSFQNVGETFRVLKTDVQTEV